MNADNRCAPWSVAITEKPDLDHQLLVEPPGDCREIGRIVVGRSTIETIDGHDLGLAHQVLDKSIPMHIIGEWGVRCGRRN